MIYALAAINKFNIFRIEIHYILSDLSFFVLMRFTILCKPNKAYEIRMVFDYLHINHFA